MIESQIIKTPEIDASDYKKIVVEALKYAIISFPFTINRMTIPDPSNRVLNIAKGKIAESLFKYYCKNENIDIDFESCETDYWQIDKRDFLFKGSEWDLKNNFLYLNDDKPFEQYTKLPALIPNRHSKDQWSTKNENKIKSSKSVKYLFTFLKASDLKNEKRGIYFLTLSLSNRQKKMLSLLYEKYKGISTEKRPFNYKRFWDEFLKDNKNIYSLNSMPNLIITGFASTENYIKFKDTGPYSDNNYQNFIEPHWYKKKGINNSLKWMNGTLWTKIKNKTAPIELLNAFSDFFTD